MKVLNLPKPKISNSCILRSHNKISFKECESEEIEPDNVNDIIDTVNDNELKEVLMTLEKKLELKGKEEGREEEKREIAKRMKNMGLDIDKIVKATNLTKEEIEKL